MRSSSMKVITWIVTVLGVVGSLVSGVKIGDIPAFDDLKIIVIISGLLGTALFAVILFAIAQILENTEYTVSKLPTMERALQRIASPEGANAPKQSLSDLTPKHTGNEWRCPKCGMMNPISSRTCKDCAYQK